MTADDLAELRSEEKVRIAGKCTLEGRRYMVSDGDIIRYKYAPSSSASTQDDATSLSNKSTQRNLLSKRTIWIKKFLFLSGYILRALSFLVSSINLVQSICDQHASCYLLEEFSWFSGGRAHKPQPLISFREAGSERALSFFSAFLNRFGPKRLLFFNSIICSEEFHRWLCTICWNKLITCFCLGLARYLRCKSFLLVERFRALS